jgi:hypothetical protein
MNSSIYSLFDLPQLLCLTVAVAAALIAAGAYWRRHRPSALATMHRVAAPAPGKIIYHDTPTVRVVDSQRVDRIRKIARLAAGEHMDVVETRAGLPPRFRVRLKRIVPHDDGAVAHVAVEFGGASVSCGPLVEEIAFNEYVLPKASRDEPRNSVYHYQESGDALNFMRIKLRAIDEAAGWAEIDVMQVSGHWPASDGH